MPLFAARPAPMPPLASAPASGALHQVPALTVLACALVVALMMSTQYLIQPFVWRNWPWDEVLAGWTVVLRDRAVVAGAIAMALVAAGRLPLATLRARALALGLAIVMGAAAGELALRVGGASGAAASTAALLSQVARWSVIAGCVATMWSLWRGVAETSAAAQAVELRSAQLERRATEARLEALRGQIEPHFLFNTLATVRRLQQVDPAQGAQLLAHFVTYLHSAQPAQPNASDTLGQEIDLARAYLGVVAQRMGGRLQVRFDVADELRPHPFPLLTIATLVENAVKHGIAPAPDGGLISVTVRRSGTAIEALVTDTGVGFTGQSGSGIGLANIRARLSTLYGSAGTLTLQANTPSGVRAAMRLPFHDSPPTASTE